MNEVAPVHLFNFSSQVPMPITLNKQERAILPKPIEKSVDTLPKPVISHKNSEVRKLEKMSKEKKEEKLAVCPSAPQQKEHRRIRRNNKERDTHGMRLKRKGSSDGSKQKSNAAVKLPGGLTDDVRVENYDSSVKERGV